MEHKYPIVICGAHPGEFEPGYMVCQHVLSGVAAAHLQRATAKSLGVVCCEACWNRRDDDAHTLQNFIVCCAQGLREKGLLASA